MKSTRLVTMFSLAVALCFALTSHAGAQCILQMGKSHSLAAARPQLGTANALQNSSTKPDVEPTIVGFWDVKFIVDNVTVDEGFDQFHADGLEILNDTSPPPTGNVCLGVFEKTGGRSIKLKHPSWIFDTDNATLIGKATALADITVDQRGNTFTGTFTLKITDLFGNQIVPDITGQVTADRITPN